QIFPNIGGREGAAQALQQLYLERHVVEKSSPSSGVANSDLSLGDPETLAGRIRVAADDHYRTRSHMLLLADHFLHALVRIIGKGFLRMFQKVFALAGLARRH